VILVVLHHHAPAQLVLRILSLTLIFLLQLQVVFPIYFPLNHPVSILQVLILVFVLAVHCGPFGFGRRISEALDAGSW